MGPNRMSTTESTLDTQAYMRKMVSEISAVSLNVTTDVFGSKYASITLLNDRSRMDGRTVKRPARISLRGTSRRDGGGNGKSKVAILEMC